jgi:hypothetical protein
VSFIAARGRLVDAIFRKLGEDAVWAGSSMPVRVILREQDNDVQMGDGPIIGVARFIRVRRSDVPAPTMGDQIAPVETGGTYQIIAEPLLDRRQVWRCEVSKDS